ncbi:helix-turn-helix domain-containing protein [Photobacterium sp. SDRW27]|uniref:helix-turn-helix domain-containing protein n=1 Tax=Photobacterium obscurum TaxID=2829490 RepID=UPI002243E909|nr:helix-turn-helix domain-containing protein [Photobacterium obscurum]MCW8328392.1 helix-turn-helix domain-containing protein [Photobacterium obscurum]
MKTWKHAPVDPFVAQFIDCYWLLEINYGDSERPEPVLIPNPNCHLVITPPDSEHHYQYSDNGDNKIISVCGTHLIMPSTRALTLLDDKQVLRLGVKFQPGAPYRLFGLDGKLTLNQTFTNLPSIHPLLLISELESMLLIRADSELVIKELDKCIAKIARQTMKDRHSVLVNKALNELEQKPSMALEKTLDCSRRTLERSFVKVTGLTLKQYEMLTRLDKLLLYIYQQPNDQLEWADIASQFGFSDQPHLIRQLKKSIGATPGSYLSARNLIIDIYGDFES